MTAPNTTPEPTFPDLWEACRGCHDPMCPHCGSIDEAWRRCAELDRADELKRAAAPELYEALAGAIGALQFSRDYHSDLGNEEQAFAQDKLDAAAKALAKARGEA